MAKAAHGKGIHSGVQSVEIASRLLQALADASRALPLTRLAAAAGMSPSKAHRYLASLVRAQLVRRDPLSNDYDIGPLGLRLGLTALERIDEVQLASAMLPRLAEEVGETIVLSVWGDHGPTIIRIQESSHTVSMNARVGSVLPPTSTATGLAFTAFLPEAAVQKVLGRTKDWSMSETPAEGNSRRGRSSVEEVRARGMARDVGVYLSGVSALAVPIFDHQGRVVAAMTALGRESTFNVDWDGPAARAMKRAAELVSRQLGYRERAGAERPPREAARRSRG